MDQFWMSPSHRSIDFRQAWSSWAHIGVLPAKSLAGSTNLFDQISRRDTKCDLVATTFMLVSAKSGHVRPHLWPQLSGSGPHLGVVVSIICRGASGGCARILGE